MVAYPKYVVVGHLELIVSSLLLRSWVVLSTACLVIGQLRSEGSRVGAHGSTQVSTLRSLRGFKGSNGGGQELFVGGTVLQRGRNLRAQV